MLIMYHCNTDRHISKAVMNKSEQTNMRQCAGWQNELIFLFCLTPHQWNWFPFCSLLIEAYLMLSEVQSNICLPYVFRSTFWKAYLTPDSTLLASPYTLSLSHSPYKIFFCFVKLVFKSLKRPPKQHCGVGGVDLVHLRVLFLTLKHH